MRSNFRKNKHFEGAGVTKSSQLVTKTATETLCHCSYIVPEEEKCIDWMPKMVNIPDVVEASITVVTVNQSKFTNVRCEI